MKLKQIFTLLLCLILLLTGCKDEALALPSPPPYTEKDLQFEEKLQNYLSQSYACQITSVEVTAQSVIIRGNKTSGTEACFVGEIHPYEDIVSMQHFSSALPVEDENFILTVERFVNEGTLTYD